MKKFTAIDLFAGIGGIKLGLTEAGFKVKYSNDIDKYCKATFEHNFKEELDNRDIYDVPLKDIPDHDLLAAGFPCQPFSLAGLKKGFSDHRGSLFFKIAEMIDDKKPKAFLLENVRYLQVHDRGRTLERILDVLRNDLGYYVPDPLILNSKNFGVPQNRARIYIVGFRRPVNFKYPTPSNNVPSLSSILEKSKAEEWYFLSQRYYEGLINHKERHDKKGNGFGLQILDPKGISNTLVVGNMGRERNLIKDRVRKGFYKTGMDKSVSRNSDGIRRLTIRECARLQGFPDTFEFPVSKTQAYKQIGNTVTVPVIAAIGKQIIKSLRELSLSERTERPPLVRSLSI